MKWVVAQGYRADNPAGDAIGAALPRHNGKSKRHHRALPHGEVAAAIETVRGSGAGIAVKLAFEFLILTAARSGNGSVMPWRVRNQRLRARLQSFRSGRSQMSFRGLSYRFSRS